LPAAAIEQTYRVYLFGSAAWSFERLDSVHDLWTSGLIEQADDREIVFELRPNVDAYFKLARLRTNAQGLRDVAYPLAGTPGTLRIAVVGSSFTMPAGVPLEGSWHYQLEQRLDALDPARKHEAINFAVGGYSARQMIAVLKKKVFAYSPQLVLFELTTHTPYLDYPPDFYSKPYAVPAVTHPFFRSFVLDRLRAPAAGPNADAVPYASDRLAAVDATMQEAAGIAAEHGVPICFLVLNMNQETAANAKALLGVARRHSSCAVDTTPAFAGMDLAKLVIYPIDAHPNAIAHGIFADAVKPYVARELGLLTP
jgi:hypothetical protein